MTTKQKDIAVKEYEKFLHGFILTKAFNNTKLYYIPKEYSDREKIIIKHNSYYYETIPDFSSGRMFISSLISDLECIDKNIPNPDITESQDEALSCLDNIGEDTFYEYMKASEFNNRKSRIKEVLDKVLDKISLPARSNKKGFYDRSKLDAIKDIICNSDCGFNVVYENEHCLIFGKAFDAKETSADARRQPILISSHADIVSTIKNVSSTYNNRIYHGTYDNLGTNAGAAAVMLLEGNNLPNDVYFAFTADEETGRCLGATKSVDFIKKLYKTNPLCIALDVTDEGYSSNSLASVEGLSASRTLKYRIRDAFMNTEGESKSLCVVKMSIKERSPFDDKYITPGTTVFDESVHYGRKLKQNTFSLCIPTSGSMHTDYGLDIKEDVFVGYIETLSSFIYTYTNTKRDIDINLGEFKDYLVKQAGKVKERYYGYYSHNYNEACSYDSYNNYDTGSYDYGDYGIDIDEIEEFASMYGESEYDCYVSDLDYNYGVHIPDEVSKKAFDNVHAECFEDIDGYDYEDSCEDIENI